MSLFIHRASLVCSLPFAWALVTLVYLVGAPFIAAEMIWVHGIKKYWSAP